MSSATVVHDYYALGYDVYLPRKPQVILLLYFEGGNWKGPLHTQLLYPLPKLGVGY